MECEGSRWKPVSQKAIEVLEVRAILAYTGKVVGKVRLEKIYLKALGWAVACVREKKR